MMVKVWSSTSSIPPTLALLGLPEISTAMTMSAPMARAARTGTGLDTAQLQVRLLELELAGEIARLPGGLFQRLATS